MGVGVVKIGFQKILVVVLSSAGAAIIFAMRILRFAQNDK